MSFFSIPQNGDVGLPGTGGIQLHRLNFFFFSVYSTYIPPKNVYLMVKSPTIVFGCFLVFITFFSHKNHKTRVKKLGSKEAGWRLVLGTFESSPQRFRPGSGPCRCRSLFGSDGTWLRRPGGAAWSKGSRNRFVQWLLGGSSHLLSRL